MSKFLSLAIPGAVSGAIYAIMASGLVLTYTTSGVFNFAHGAIAFATALVYYQLREGLDLPLVPAAILAVAVFAPTLGWALDRLMLRRLASAPPYARIVGTVGLLIALPNLMLWGIEQANLRGGNVPTTQQVFNAPGLGPSPAHIWHPLDNVTINSDQVVVFAAAALCAVVLWLVIRRTPLGLRLRADVDRRELAELRGVNTAQLSSVAWGLSTSLAGLGGVLLAPFFGLDSNTYTFVVLGSLAAVIVARFRSLPIAFAAGLAVGVVQNMVAGYGDDVLPNVLTDLAGFRTAVPFMLALAGLVLFTGVGPRTRNPAGERPPAPLPEVAPWRRRAPWVVSTAALLVYVLWAADDFWAGLIARGVVFGVIFLSITLVTGLGGMVSLSQTTFVTAGGMMAAWLVTHTFSSSVPLLMSNGHVNFGVAAVAGAAVSMIAGVVVAVSVRRLSPLTLALMTLVIAFLADLIVFQLDEVNNNQRGYRVTPPSWGPIDLSNPRHQVVTFLIVFGLVMLLIRNVVHSPTGRAMFATRSSDIATRSVGLSPHRARAVVFALSAGIAGLGGALYAVVAGTFTKTTAPPLAGLIWITVVVTLGVRRPGGALLAGLSFGVGAELLPRLLSFSQAGEDLTRSAYFQPILFGLNAISLARFPDGVLDLRLWTPWRRRREAAGSAPAGPAADGLAVSTPSWDALEHRDVESNVVSGDRSGEAGLLIERLSGGYGDHEVIHDVSLVVPRGRIVAVVGANGAGKSTLCKLIGGTLPATQGRIEIVGRDAGGWAAHRRARAGLAVLPESRGIFPGLSVDDNLRLWLPRAEDREAAYDRFSQLAQRRGVAAGMLSGGEQQMLALAGMIVKPPAVLVADEPTLGLAPLVCDMVWETMRELRDMGVSLLLVEEKTTNVVELADDVVVLSLGRAVWSGPKEGLDPTMLTATYLGASTASPG